MTNSATPTLTTIQTIFKDLVWDPLIVTGETALFAWEAPALSIPVIGTVLTAGEKEIISLATDWLFSQLSLLIDMTVIPFIDKSHQAAFDSAAEKLLVIAHDSGPTSQAFEDAKNAEKTAFLAFIHPTVG